MAVYEYKALNSKGKKISGIIDADSLSSARTKLKQMQIFPTQMDKIAAQSTEKEPDRKRFSFQLRLFSKVNSAELSMITRQMSTLLSAGFPLVKAVGTLVSQARSKAMQKVLSRIKDAIEEGSSFAEALSLYPNVFSPIFINMVHAGESSGTLEIVLERLADFNENREESRKKIQASLAYPILMSIVGVGVLIVLLTYVVPGIVNIFTDMNQTLPLPTTILISTSHFFQTWWWAVILTPLLFLFLLYLIRKTQKGEYVTDRILISLPITGPLLKKIIAARFARTLGSLLDNGVPMMTALNISKSIAGNKVVNNLISKVCETVEQGGEIGRVLEKSNAFPSLAAQMIMIGETSGELEKMLEKAADLYEKDIKAAVSAASALIEPIIILVMGVVVGSIILAICMPIFEINQMIQ